MATPFDMNLPWVWMRRCILNPNGTVAYYLDPNDSNKKEDGTAVDWAAVESAGQNCMVEIPKFWCTKYANGDDMVFGVSNQPKDGYVVHPAFYRQRDRLCDVQNSDPVPEVDYRYIGAFEGWVDSSNRLRSLPNKTVTVSQTIGTFRNYAKNNGNGWGQLDFNLLYAIQMLYLVEYAHFNSQTKIGRGFVGGNTATIPTGRTLSLGNHTGNEANLGTDDKHAMSYRGIENFWGNVHKWVDGLYCNASRQICIGNKGFNNTGAGYAVYNTGLVANISGYITDIFPDAPLGFIIKVGGGSATTKLCDYGNLCASCLPIFGGDWSYASNAGAFCLYVSYAASSVSSAVGGRLVY